MLQNYDSTKILHVVAINIYKTYRKLSISEYYVCIMHTWSAIIIFIGAYLALPNILSIE